MPYIDLQTPVVKPVADKANVRYVTIDRFGADADHPEARFVLMSGYYVTDTSGNPVLNALGYPKFQPEGWTKEASVRLDDPVLQAIFAEADAGVKAYVATHPEVPFIAVVDDFLANIAIAYYQATNPAPAPPAE